MQAIKHFPKILSSFLALFLLILFVGIFWFLVVSFVFASSSFTEDFSNTTNINKSYDLDIDTAGHTAQMHLANTILLDGDTLLLTHLGSDLDIISPAIGVGGTVSNVTYDVGYDGNAANIKPNGSIIFPIDGNMNLQSGTISLWAKMADWTGATEQDFFGISGTVWWFFSGHKVYIQFNNSGVSKGTAGIDVSGFAPNSWHHFVFYYNYEGRGYAQQGEIGLTVDDAISTRTTFQPFTFTTVQTTFRVGSSGGGGDKFEWIDEFRIMATRYSTSSSYPEIAFLESKGFDTGVANPVWGNISWDQSLATKTDIQFQTNVSADGSSWEGWLEKGIIVLSFSDTPVSAYTNAKPIMDEFGYKGNVSVVPYWVDYSPATLTLTQIRSLVSDGWSLETEGYNHTVLTTLTPAQLPDYFAQTQQYFADNGLTANTWEYAGGTAGSSSTNDQEIDILSEYYSHAWDFPSYSYPTASNNFSYDQKFWIDGKSGANLINAETYVDNCESNKGLQILYWHTIGAGGDMSDDDFRTLLSYIASKNVEVLNLDQALAKLSYRVSAGTQITSSSKRYIKYRAVFSSYNFSNTPTLSSVKISAPSKIYKNIATIIDADGTYKHETWPQTTDISIDNLTVIPSADSVIVNVDTWNTTSTYYKKWTESSASSTIATTHTIGDLRANQYYQIKVNDSVLGILQANGSGQISFTYSSGYSTKTFKVEEIPTAPTIGTPTTLSSNSIRWNFIDNADNETCFELYDNSDNLISTQATANLTYIDETGLSENTQYMRYIKAYNDYGNSSSSATTSKYTLTDTPTNLAASDQGDNTITLKVDTFPNYASSSSGYYFFQTKDESNHNSGWIQTNTWQDTGLACSQNYSYSVKYRNGDETETDALSANLSTNPCGSVVLPTIIAQGNRQNQEMEIKKESKQVKQTVEPDFSFQAKAVKEETIQQIKTQIIIIQQQIIQLIQQLILLFQEQLLELKVQ